MAKLVVSSREVGYTILPYTLTKPLQFELIAHPSDYVLGYISYNEYTAIRKFTYTESGCLNSVHDHWSLSIMKEFPYCENNGPWIVYSCPPEKVSVEFGKLISSEALHIHNWDTWSVVGKHAKVAVVTSQEIF